jgi:hypothetical protein
MLDCEIILTYHWHIKRGQVIVNAESQQDILDHLKAFHDIYEYSEIIEVRASVP